MGLIEFYIIFALATGITSWYLFYAPAFKEAKLLNAESESLKHPVFSGIVYIILATLVAPVIFPPIIFTKTGERFKNGLLNSLLKQQ